MCCGGCVQDFWPSPPDPPPPDRPSPGPPKISLFFFPSPAAKIRSFLPSLGVFSLNFGGVLEDQDPQMCTRGRRGFTRQTRELQTRTFERPGASNTTKFPLENPQREERMKFPVGEGKKARNFGPPPFGPTLRAPHPFGPPLFLGSGPNPLGAPTLALPLRAPPFGAPTFGAPLFGPPLFWVRAPTLSAPSPLGPHPSAKCGIGQVWSWPNAAK